jgi:exonuclease VII small subunit
MTQINNARLPSFYGEHSVEQLNQLVLSLEQVILQLNTSYTPPSTENNAQAVIWFLGE